MLRLLFGVIALVLLHGFLFAFTVKANPQAPWLPRKLAFQPGCLSLLSCVAAVGLLLCGARVVSEHRVPPGFWLLLAGLLPAGCLAARAVLRFLRRDFSGRGWIDAPLLGLPWAGACWLVLLGFYEGTITFLGVLACVFIALFALFALPTNKEWEV